MDSQSQQIKFLNDHFSADVDQTFYVQSAPESYLKDAPDNVISITKGKLLCFVFAAHKADRIIFNGLFYRKIIILFAFMPWLLSKAVWVPWGADLYWRLYEVDTISKALFLIIKGWFVRRLYAIATGTFADYEAAINWYGNGPKYINSGCNIYNYDNLDLDQLIENKNSDSVCRIQLGNSADPTNDHLEAMELLRRFAGENIQVYVPLSYGKISYAEKIIDKGSELFGEKFIPMTQFMSATEYNKHLSNVDILIFNHRRQQGFNNIIISLYLGSKVFIRQEVSLWNHLIDDLGCIVSSTDEIQKSDYQKFIENNLKTIKKNKTAVKKLFSKEWQKENWSRMYIY